MSIIVNGDSLEWLKSQPDNTITTVVTDPPYGLKFMSKRWDYDIPSIELWAELLRVVKPGGMMLCFGGSRTYHRLTCRIEDAGWEIRDCIMWLYGSGFPKSHNHFGFEGFGTALKPAYETIIMAMKPLDGTFKQNAEKWGVAGINIDGCRIPTLTGQLPLDKISNKEVLWEQEKCLCSSCANLVISRMKRDIQEIGVFSAIKDVELILIEKGKQNLTDLSIEDIGCLDLLFQEEPNTNPKGSLYLSMLKSGKIFMGKNQKDLLSITLTITLSTIELKICNLCKEAITSNCIKLNIQAFKKEMQSMQSAQEKSAQGSRWPANIILDEEAGALLDQQSGVTKSSTGKRRPADCKGYSGGLKAQPNLEIGHTDSGGASRFFYCAKASTSERNDGLEGMPLKDTNKIGTFNEPGNNGSLKNSKPMQNSHPTVKPLKLMEYLIKLVMPPKDGLLLDPFAGSGTTILAAQNLGFNAIGIEREKEYCDIAEARIKNGEKQMRLLL